MQVLLAFGLVWSKMNVRPPEYTVLLALNTNDKLSLMTLVVSIMQVEMQLLPTLVCLKTPSNLICLYPKSNGTVFIATTESTKTCG